MYFSVHVSAAPVGAKPISRSALSGGPYPDHSSVIAVTFVKRLMCHRACLSAASAREGYRYQIPWYFTHPTRDMGEQLLAVPCCGLGNRISLLLGAIAVAKNASLNLTVAWRTDPVLVRTAPKQQQSAASRTVLLSLTCVLPRASECTLRRAVRAVVHRRRRQRQRPLFAVRGAVRLATALLVGREIFNNLRVSCYWLLLRETLPRLRG